VGSPQAVNRCREVGLPQDGMEENEESATLGIYISLYFSPSVHASLRCLRCLQNALHSHEAVMDRCNPMLCLDINWCVCVFYLRTCYFPAAAGPLYVLFAYVVPIYSFGQCIHSFSSCVCACGCVCMCMYVCVFI
jgi:hypothetical protein